MHLQNILDYGRFNLLINDIFPSGNYGLSWTFERQGGFPRYAAFFANPLEFSASLLLFLSLGLHYLLHSKYNINRLALPMLVDISYIVILFFLFKRSNHCKWNYSVFLFAFRKKVSLTTNCFDFSCYGSNIYFFLFF